MRVIDVHVHLRGKASRNDVEAFVERTGVESLCLFSSCPLDPNEDARRNIEALAELTGKCPGLIHPFTWVDAVDDEAVVVTEWAVQACGMVGVKLLPRNFHPADPRVQEVYAAAGRLGVPILIHTGILWSPGVNADHCRPANMEVMWHHPETVFAMAHIGWPWTDECIAVAQKLNRMRPELDQVFVDITPGTPPSYRQDALAKCLENVHADHMLYGSDAGIPSSVVPEGNWRKDSQLLDRLGVSPEDQQRIFSGNAARFLHLDRTREGA